MAKSGSKQPEKPSKGSKVKKEEEEEQLEYSHPGASNADRFPINQLLRKHGFQIWERKAGKEPVWSKRGVMFTQSEALLRIDPEEIVDIQYAKQLGSGPID